jgi:hypothetical protein
MILRRMIAWVTGGRAAAVRIVPAAGLARPDDVLAPEEFARLLRSGDPEDLKRLAMALSRLDLSRV